MKISDRVRLSETGSSNPADQGFYVLSGRVLVALISDAIVWTNGLLLTQGPYYGMSSPRKDNIKSSLFLQSFFLSTSLQVWECRFWCLEEIIENL